VDVTESKTNEINIHNQWPKSYGEFADSITRQSSRKSKNIVRVSSQYLTKEQMDGLAWIVSSPLVQILSTSGGVTTARTVIVDTSTLKKYQDRDNLYSISFNITYTDELPVQTS
jgi:aspartate carbamoyltransferase regulatory subunit